MKDSDVFDRTLLAAVNNLMERLSQRELTLPEAVKQIYKIRKVLEGRKGDGKSNGKPS